MSGDDGYGRLAAGVLGSALRLPPRQRDDYLDSIDFTFWARVAGCDPDGLRRQFRRLMRHGVAPDTHDVRRDR